jgi:hypothetical protein
LLIKKLGDKQMWTDILLIGSFIVFGVYICWYIFFGKTPQPLTSQEVSLIWVMHKKQTGCTGTRINNFLLDEGKIVGFRCKCGYEYVQKRPMVQNILKPNTSLEFSGWISSSEIKSEGTFGTGSGESFSKRVDAERR